MANKSALVLLAQGCEELEAVTIIDLLRRASIEVVTAGLDAQPVVASRKTKLIPDTTLDQAMKRTFDMVVLPGGLPGADHLANDARVIKLLEKQAGAGRFVAAICAAPVVLAKAGLIEGKRATCYPGCFDGLKMPGVKSTGEAVVRDGQILTSRGPGTALDFALALIEALVGKETRQTVEKALVRT